jgi:hypothetical protein
VVLDGTHWAAIFTSIGGLATAGALLVSLILLRQQMRELRQGRLDRRREQASSIGFWLESGGIDSEGDVAMLAHVVNTSKLPAMTARVEVGLELAAWRDASAPNGKAWPQKTDHWSADAVAPASTQTLNMYLQALPDSVARQVRRSVSSAIIGELSFTDASGVHWIRTARGHLMEGNSPQWMALALSTLAERADALGRVPFESVGPFKVKDPFEVTTFEAVTWRLRHLLSRPSGKKGGTAR